EVGGIDKLQQSSFGVGVRDNRFGADLFAGGKYHADSNAVLDANFNDLYVAADFGASSFGRGRHGLGHRSHATGGKVCRARRMRITGSADEQHQTGSGRPRTEECTENSAR